MITCRDIKISNYGDVLSFIEDVIEGNDRYAKERRELNEKNKFLQ